MPVFSVAAPTPDPVFALMARYKADPHPKKADLGIGAYRTNDGAPWVLPVVRKVDEQLAADPKVNHEYLPLDGNPEFRKASAKLIFGDGADLSKIATVQTLSGTGANHMGGALLAESSPFGKGSKTIWVSAPTWGNHHTIFHTNGLQVKEYKYWNGERKEIDFGTMMNQLKNEAQPGDSILLHACAHNPTGMDPTEEQWKQIAEVMKSRSLFAFFDCAYQGFASGDLNRDAWAVRYFVEQRIPLLVCQSFSKNMGLYGERTGAIHIVDPQATPESVSAYVGKIASQTRAEVSNCPSYGARIATKILTTPELFEQWKKEVKIMADRIISMRQELRKRIEGLHTPGKWSHITDQIGMFSFTGLTKDQVRRMVDEFHIYLVGNGRISMAGVNSSNVDYIARSLHAVVTGDRGHL